MSLFIFSQDSAPSVGTYRAAKSCTYLRIFALTCVLFGAVVSHAANWYVDSTATGANNGTSWSNAWTALTQAEVWATSNFDVIYVSGGATSQTYTTGYINYSGRTLKTGQDAGHNGMVIFDGQGTQANFLIGNQVWCNISGDNGSGDGLPHMTMTNYSNIVINGDHCYQVKIDHLNIFSLVRFQAATNIEIAYCQLTAPNNSDYLINLIGTGGPPGSTNYSDCSIHNCALLSPRAFASNALPGEGADFIQGGANCSVYSNTFNVYFANFTEGQHQDGWQTVGPYLAMHDNLLANIANYGLYCELYGTGGNVLFYNNVVVQNAPMVNDTGLNVGVVIGPQAVNNQTFYNIVVANNTFVDMFGRSAIAMGQSGTSNTWVNSYIINNLVYNCGGNGYAALAFDNLKNGVLTTNGITMAYNVIQTGLNGTTLGMQQLTAPVETTTVKFVNYSPISTNNDLHLSTSDQAARKRGLNLTPLFPFLALDKDGNPRPASGPWDIGAYQSIQGTNVPPPPTGLHVFGQ